MGSVGEQSIQDAAEAVALEAVRIDEPTLHERYVRQLPETNRRLHVHTYVNSQAEKETIAVDEATLDVVDLALALEDETRAHSARCGVLDRALCDVLGSLPSTDTVPVVIWLRHDYRDVDSTLAAVDPIGFERALEETAQRHRAVADSARARLEAALGRSALSRSDYVPMLSGRLTAAEVQVVAADPQVGAVRLTGGEIVQDLADSLSLAGWSIHPSYDGTGVKVGILEPDRPDDVSELPPLTIRDPSGPTSAHARLVTGIVANTTATAGFANDANLYIANRMATDTGSQDVDWAVFQQAAVHNQSWHRNPDDRGTDLSARDEYLDFMTRTFRVLFITAASNSDAYPVVHKGYNIITVGSTYNDGSIVDGSWSDSCGLPSSYVSTWQNDANGQELPHITALGSCISAVSLTDWSGTSFAAPAVTGMAAGLVESNSQLLMQPEALKAILLASPIQREANSPDGCPWRFSSLSGSGSCTIGDGRDGAGLVNGARARQMAGTRSTGFPAAQYAHDFGFVNRSNFDPSTHLLTTKHYARGPASCSPLPYLLRVVLAWNSNASCTFGNDKMCSDNLEMDLDILVYEEPGGTLVGQSSTTTNSYEVAADVPIRGQLGSCSPAGPNWYYRIEVRLSNYDSVPTNAGTNFGLAWQWYL